MTAEVDVLDPETDEHGAVSESVELAERRARVSRLLLSGLTMEEIARQTGSNRSAVVRDIRAIKESWHREATENVGGWYARDLAVLAEMERDAALAFNRLLRPPKDQIPDYPGALDWYLVRLKTLQRRARLLGYENRAPDHIVNQNLTMNLNLPDSLMQLLNQDDDTLEAERRRLLRCLPATLDQPDSGGPEEGE